MMSHPFVNFYSMYNNLQYVTHYGWLFKCLPCILPVVLFYPIVFQKHLLLRLILIVGVK